MWVEFCIWNALIKRQIQKSWHCSVCFGLYKEGHQNSASARKVLTFKHLEGQCASGVSSLYTQVG